MNSRAIFERTLCIPASILFWCLLLEEGKLIAAANPNSGRAVSNIVGGADNRVHALKPGNSQEGDLQAGQQHTFEIEAKTGQFIHVVVDQLGIDVALTLYDPNGTETAATDSRIESFGLKQLSMVGLQQISAIAGSTGAYRLVLTAPEKVPSGRYRLKLAPPRAPNQKDQQRISAERLFFQGEELKKPQTGDSFQRAIQKQTEALPLWREAGDHYGQALTFQSIGAMYNQLGEKQRAMGSFNQALLEWRAINDHAGEAVTLCDLGSVSSQLGQKQKAMNYYNQALPLARSAARVNDFETGTHEI
jgi:Tetratricopeptide repeat